MTFLLDTNTVSYYLRGDARVVKRIQALEPRDLAISAVKHLSTTALHTKVATTALAGMLRRRHPRETGRKR